MSRSEQSRRDMLKVSRTATVAPDFAAPTKEGPGSHVDEPPVEPLSALRSGTRGRIVRVTRDLTTRAERLAALGVSAGAAVRVLQTFPGIVFECDQTELAVERIVARGIWIEVSQDSR
jgi:Fe2+ transport system protein FeoA